MIDIEELERFEKAATPGPWIEGLLPSDAGVIFPAVRYVRRTREENGPYVERGLMPVGIDTVMHFGREPFYDARLGTMQIPNSPRFREDATLIVAARNALSALLAELKAGREVAEAARQVERNAGDDPDFWYAIGKLKAALAAYDAKMSDPATRGESAGGNEE